MGGILFGAGCSACFLLLCFALLHFVVIEDSDSASDFELHMLDSVHDNFSHPPSYATSKECEELVTGDDIETGYDTLMMQVVCLYSVKGVTEIGNTPIKPRRRHYLTAINGGGLI